MIVVARVEPDESAPGCFCVRVNHDGPVVIAQESFAVCERVADALVHPERWHCTEIGEVADAIAAQHKGDSNE